MTTTKRENEIIQAAKHRYPFETWIFIDGAKWADAHPALSVVANVMNLLRTGKINAATPNKDVMQLLIKGKSNEND